MLMAERSRWDIRWARLGRASSLRCCMSYGGGRRSTGWRRRASGEDRGLPWWWRAFTSSFHHEELSGSWTMISILKKLGPPTKNGKLSVLWALVFGFVLQLALPAVLIALGFKGAALLAIYPGLLPIIWA